MIATVLPDALLLSKLGPGLFQVGGFIAAVTREVASPTAPEEAPDSASLSPPPVLSPVLALSLVLELSLLDPPPPQPATAIAIIKARTSANNAALFPDIISLLLLLFP
jgi:hypothetical protein